MQEALQVRTVIPKANGSNSSIQYPNHLNPISKHQYIGSDQKNSNVLMPCFDSRREKAASCDARSLTSQDGHPEGQRPLLAIFWGQRKEPEKGPSVALILVFWCLLAAAETNLQVLWYDSLKHLPQCSAVVDLKGKKNHKNIYLSGFQPVNYNMTKMSCYNSGCNLKIFQRLAGDYQVITLKKYQV